MSRSKCPSCGNCPFLEGQCVEKIARGRRFFLVGALALPVAAKIARVAQLVQPAYEAPKLTRIERIVVNGQEWTYDGSGEWPWQEINSEFEIAVAT